MSHRSGFAFLLALCVLAAPGIAWGGPDAHGQPLPPGSGDPADPIFSQRPVRQVPWAWHARGLFEYVEKPLVRIVQRGEEYETEVLLDDVFGLNLAGAFAVHERVGVGVGLPVWFGTGGTEGGGGPALGDASIHVPVGLVLPDEAGKGLGLSLSPEIRLPTGAQRRYLGDDGLGVQVDLLASYGVGPLAISVDAGVGRRKLPEFENIEPGPLVAFAAAVALSPVEPLALHLETRAYDFLKGDSKPSAEALFGVSGRTGGGLTFAAGISRGLTSGIGSPAVRAFAGVGFARTPDEEVPGEEPGRDAPWNLTVLDPAGHGIADAIFLVGGLETARTDADGRAVIDGLRWKRGVEVQAQGFLARTLTEPPEGRDVAVTLPWKPVPMRVVVKDQAGAPVRAEVDLLGSGAPPPVEVSPEGAASFELPPGTWQVEVAHDAMGRQLRDVIVPPFAPPLSAEAILAPDAGPAGERVLVSDVEGNPLADVRVFVDGVPLGATSTGGTLEAWGFSVGPHKVEVVADAFQSLEMDEVAFTEGLNALDVVLKRSPGSVKVIANGPEGRVPDAVVRFDGPSRLPPQVLGEDGERIVQVRPGTWSVLVVSPTHGMQTREIVVPPDKTSLTVVEVVLQPSENGLSELALRIIDPDGRPVDQAQVLLDGKSYGTTSSGGTMRIPGLDEGPRTLVVRGDRHRPLDPIDLFLVEGRQERIVTLEWNPGSVYLTARSDEGEVDDGVVRFSGPGPADPLALGAHGEAYTTLAAGEWRLLVASEEHGLQQRTLSVPEDSTSLLVADVLFTRGEGGPANLRVEVTDPEGRPVDGAQVLLDGNPVGTTLSAGSIELDHLKSGSRTVAVEAPLFARAAKRVALVAGDQAVKLPLSWAPGAVKVVTRTEEGPVTDAVVRFSGPESRAPVRVDRNGERLVALSPGSWQGLASSATAGLQQRQIEIAADQKGLVVAEFLMKAVEQGRSELMVRVVDPDGNPVPGAVVRLDGTERGVTATGGALLVPDLLPGRMSFEVVAKDFLPGGSNGLMIREGSQERIVELAWEPAPVRVQVKDSNGNPVQAEIRADGPAEFAPVRTSADGTALIELPPGHWQVLAFSSELGTRSFALDVAPGAEAEEIRFELEAAKVAVTAAEVVIREKVMFDFDRATLRPESAKILEEVAATILASPGIAKVEIQGHTDATGGAAYNHELSQRRAEAVVEALVARGVAPERLQPRGYGATAPLVPNDTEENRAVNRRVQFEIKEIAAE